MILYTFGVSGWAEGYVNGAAGYYEGSDGCVEGPSGAWKYCWCLEGLTGIRQVCLER